MEIFLQSQMTRKSLKQKTKLHKKEQVKQGYISKHNLEHENQSILLKITDGQKRHYLAKKNLSRLI